MNSWRQYWQLLKVQLPSALRGQSKGSKDSTRSRVGYVLLMTFAMAAVLGTLTVAYIGMAEVLGPTGQLRIIPALAMVGGCLFCLFTTIYKTNGLLFGFRDYDLVMSLPIRSSIVVAARLTILYVYNLTFLLTVLVPAGVVYGIYAGADFWFYLLFSLETLLAPLIPVVLATILGTLIAMLASRFRRRGPAGILLTITFMIVWMLFVYNADSVIDQFAVLGPQIYAAVVSAYPPAEWFTAGCCDGSAGSLALFAGISIGIFAAFCLIVGRYFRAINTMLTSFGASSHFQMTALKSAGIRKALLHKEFKRLTASSNYFLNAAIGPIMAIVLSVLMYAGVAELSSLTDMEEAGMDVHLGYVLVALFISMMTGMAECTAASISIEGRQLWIIKTAPVPTREILRAKRTLNIILMATGAVIGGIFLMLSFPFSPLYSPFLILTPLIVGLFTTMWGQKLNLKFARFDWTEETQIVKRSKPVMYQTLALMGTVFAAMMLSVILGSWVMFVMDAVLVVLTVLIYRWLETAGVKAFDSFSA